MEPLHAKVVAGATGSTLTTLTMTPFDVVKTRLQTQPPTSPPRFTPGLSACCQPSNIDRCVRNMSSFARSLAAEEIVCIWEQGVMKTERVNGFYDAVKHVWKAEGFAGLWKGTGTTFLIAVPSQTGYMLTYDRLLNVTLPPLISFPALVPLAAGTTARTAIAIVASPLEMLRTNLQSTPLSPEKPITFRSTLGSLLSLVRRDGLQSLWRGLPPTLWRDVPFSGIYWSGYEWWKRTFAKYGHSGLEAVFFSGAISGMVAASITSPFDVLKTRRQALLMKSSGSRSIIPLTTHIIRTEGVKALFAGLGPRLAKIVPACGIMITSYEGIGRLLTK